MAAPTFFTRALYRLLPVISGLLLNPAAKAFPGNIQPTFSLDPASPSLVGGLTTADVLSSGPSPVVLGVDLGLDNSFPNGQFDNLDALSHGNEAVLTGLYFSVDRLALGQPGSAVRSKAMPNADAAADIFFSNLNGQNSLVLGGDSLGLVPGLAGDDIDALDIALSHENNWIYFSVDSLSLTNGSQAGSILSSSGAGSFTLFADAAAMGFNNDSDLDALILLDLGIHGGAAEPGIDRALFSLSSFSPDTFTGSGSLYLAGVLGHLSPADVLYTTFDGSFQLYAKAEDLGLLPDDELDSLATASVPGPLPLTGFAAALHQSRVIRRRLRTARSTNQKISRSRKI